MKKTLISLAVLVIVAVVLVSLWAMNRKPKAPDSTLMIDTVASQPEAGPNPISLLEITRDFKADTSVAKYGYNFTTSGSVVWIARTTFSADMRIGSGEIIGRTLCLNGVASKATLDQFGTRIVANFQPEAQVIPDIPNHYILGLTINRADFDTEDLMLSFYWDDPPSPTQEASPSGYWWVNPNGSHEGIRLNSTLTLQ
jgi:hypothetical protein